MQSAINIPIINIVHKTLEDVQNHNYKKVGLLASESTCEMNLYDNAFIEQGIEVIKPSIEAQDKINTVIENVMGGNQGARDKKVLLDILREYKDGGAQAAVMGCTEIPLALSQKDTEFPLFDAMDAIVKYAVDASLA